jgi:WD40 repeat protein
VAASVATRGRPVAHLVQGRTAPNPVGHHGPDRPSDVPAALRPTTMITDMPERIEDADAALDDCAYPVTADAAEVIPLLGRARTPRARLAAAVYRLSLTWHRWTTPQVRRQILSLDAARLGDGELARRFAEVPVAGAAAPKWTPRWATGNEADERLLLAIPAHVEWANAVVCAELDGRPLAVTGGHDALVHVWDLATGQTVGDPFARHGGPVEAVVRTELEGRPLIVSSDAEGEVWVWDLADREPVQTLSPKGLQPGRPLASTDLDGRLIVVTGDRDTARAWDVATGERVGPPMSGHTGGGIPPLQAMTCTRLDGHVVLVTVGEQGLVWDLATGERIAELVPPGRPGDHTMTTVACTELDGRPVAVAACATGEVLLWDLAGRALVGDPLGGGTGGARDIICTDLDGRRVALVGDWNGNVRVWDLATGELLARPVGHPVSGFADVRALAHAVVGGRPVVVTCGHEGWVRVWDMGAHEPAGRPVVGHTMEVHAVAPAEIDGRAVVLSGGSDHGEEDWEEHTRLWDLATGEPIGGPMVWFPTGDSREEDVAALTYLRLDGRDVAVAGVDRSVRLWDLGAGRPIGGPMVHTTEPGRFSIEKVECTRVDDRPIAVSFCNGGLRVWDLRTCEPFDAPAPGGDHWLHAAACTMLDGRAVVVTGAWTGRDGSDECGEAIQLWDLASGEPIGSPLGCRVGTVRALACAEVDGRCVAVTGGDDGTVRRWDLCAGRQIGAPMAGCDEYAVRSVTCMDLDGRPIAVSAGPDTVQAWDLRTGDPFGPTLHFPCYINDVTTTPQGHLVVALGSDIAVLTLSP